MLEQFFSNKAFGKGNPFLFLVLVIQIVITLLLGVYIFFGQPDTPNLLEEAMQNLKAPVKDNYVGDTAIMVRRISQSAAKLAEAQPQEIVAPPKPATPIDSSNNITEDEEDQVQANESKPSNSETVAVTPVVGSNLNLDHTVQPGETLYSIAIRYNVTRAQLRSINGLKSDADIKANQALKIPIQATHIVTKGDNLSFLAKKYGSDIASIIRANKLEGQTLKEGSQVVIPVVKL